VQGVGGGGRGCAAGFCSEVGLASLESEVRAPAAGFVGFVSGAFGAVAVAGAAGGAAAGSAAAGWALSALPRGQLKSSARPPGAATGSPLVITRETVASTAGAAARPPPTRSSRPPRLAGRRPPGPHHRPPPGPP